MNKICPVLTNKDTKKEFDLLKDHVGEKGAYDIWNLNKGNMIDKSPKGDASTLFNQILDKVGDYNKAIGIKSKIYGKSFKKAYGIFDWSNPLTTDNYNVVFLAKNIDIAGHDESKFLNFDKSFGEKLEKFNDNYMSVEMQTASYRAELDLFIKDTWNELKDLALSENKIMFTLNPEIAFKFSQQFDAAITTSKEKTFNYFLETLLDKTQSQTYLDRLYSASNSISNRYTLDNDYSLNQLAKEPILNELGEPNIEYSNGLFIIKTESGDKVMFDASDTLLNADDVQTQLDKFNENTQDFETILSDLRRLIRLAVESRINAINARKIPNKAQLLAPLEQQLLSLKNPAITDLENILYLLADIKRSMSAPINHMLNALKRLKMGLEPGITNNMLILFQLDFYGMYNNLLENVALKIFDNDHYANILGKEQFEQLKKDVSTIREGFKAALQSVSELTTHLAAKTLLKHGMKVGDYTLKRFVLENLITTENDISVVMRCIGAGDKQNDLAVKSVFKMVSDVDDSVRFSTYEQGSKLLKLLTKVGGSLLMLLFEYDNDGKKTGYFIREKKYGMFLNNYKAKLKELRAKYEVPSELNQPVDIEKRILFNSEVNEWLSKNCERRYTKEYYDAFNSLSEEARNRRDMIQFKIYQHLDKFRDENGKPHLERMSPNEYKLYENYRFLLRMLSSYYYEDGSPKCDIDLSVAKELNQLHQKLGDGFEYEVDMDAFKTAKDVAKNTLSKKDYEVWKKRYTRTKISDEFYEMLDKIEKKKYGERYNELNKMYKDILKPYKNPITGQPDTSLFSNEVVKTLNGLDRAMRQIRKDAAKRKTVETEEGEYQFEEIAETKVTASYEIDKRNAVNMGDEFYQAWYDSNHIFYKGKAIPRKYYTYLVPKDKNLIDTEYPSSDFNVVSNESAFVNKNYDRNVNEYYQPNKTYDNKDFNKIFNITVNSDGSQNIGNKPLWELYQGLLETMKISNEKLTFLTKNNEYRIPQMSGSMYQYAMKDGTLQSLLNGTQKYVEDKFGVTNDLVGYTDKPTTRPDGSPLRMVPTYYIKDLEDPDLLTNDLTGAVISFFKMADNFKKKTEILPDVEIINYQMKNRIYYGGKSVIDESGKKLHSEKDKVVGLNTNSSKFMLAFIDMNVYGESTKSMEFTVKDKKYSGAKILGFLKLIGTFLGLGLNASVATVGFVTAFILELGFAMNSRVFDNKSMVKAYVNMLKNLGSALLNTVSLTTDNKYIECMKFFEIGTEFKNSYKNSNRMPFIETIARNWAFGLFTTSDFIIKGTILNAVMQNYRYFDGKFLSKELFLDIFDDKTNLKSVWDSLESVYDSIEMENGMLSIKDDAKRAAFDEVKAKIGGTARSLSATADGLLTELLKQQLAANAFWGLVFMFRNYIPNLILEKISMKKQYDQQLGIVREAEYRAVFRLTSCLIKDLKNKEKFNDWYSKLDRSDRASLKLFYIYEVPLLLLLNGVLIPAIKSYADDDKDNWLINFAALLATKSAGEFTNMFNPYDLYRTLKSVSSLPDLISPFTNILSILTIKDLINNDETIKYGTYKGNTRTERALWKLTPLKNIKELQDPATKRKYYEQMYDK